tara:strand:+ start:380 stop:565 length:186 start_codon:yes stop_codon:yes gene_type:complete
MSIHIANNKDWKEAIDKNIYFNKVSVWMIRSELTIALTISIKYLILKIASKKLKLYNINRG